MGRTKGAKNKPKDGQTILPTSFDPTSSASKKIKKEKVEKPPKISAEEK